MKPIFSDQSRTQIVTYFIVARYNRRLKINSYERLVPYLSQGRIPILCDLKKTGLRQILNPDKSFKEFEKIFNEDDAKTYFEWLMATVTGSKSNTPQIVQEANNQLFQFIDVLGDAIEMEKTMQLVTPYDWEALFTSFGERLTEMQKIIIKGENDVAETLSKILLWIEKYSPTLDAIEDERQKLLGSGQGKGK